MKSAFKALLLLSILAGCLALWTPGFLSRASHRQWVWWLPNAASDISYCRKSGISSDRENYEFSISKEGFVKWAKSKYWSMEPFGPANIGKRVTRYTSILPEGHSERQFSHVRIGELEKAPAESGFEIPEPLTPAGEITAYHGLFYEYRARNNGGIVVLYDDDRGRAYVESSTN